MPIIFPFEAVCLRLIKRLDSWLSSGRTSFLRLWSNWLSKEETWQHGDYLLKGDVWHTHTRTDAHTLSKCQRSNELLIREYAPERRLALINFVAASCWGEQTERGRIGSPWRCFGCDQRGAMLSRLSSAAVFARVKSSSNHHQLEPDADEVVYIHWLRRCVEVLCTIKLNRNSSFQSSMTTIF